MGDGRTAPGGNESNDSNNCHDSQRQTADTARCSSLATRHLPLEKLLNQLREFGQVEGLADGQVNVRVFGRVGLGQIGAEQDHLSLRGQLFDLGSEFGAEHIRHAVIRNHYSRRGPALVHRFPD